MIRSFLVNTWPLPVLCAGYLWWVWLRRPPGSWPWLLFAVAVSGTVAALIAAAAGLFIATDRDDPVRILVLEGAYIAAGAIAVLLAAGMAYARWRASR